MCSLLCQPPEHLFIFNKKIACDGDFKTNIHHLASFFFFSFRALSCVLAKDVQLKIPIALSTASFSLPVSEYFFNKPIKISAAFLSSINLKLKFLSNLYNSSSFCSHHFLTSSTCNLGFAFRKRSIFSAKNS